MLSMVFMLEGSVFPKSLWVAIPCCAMTAALTAWIEYGELSFLSRESVLLDNAAWGGFSFLVGFLIVFRTSQSYNRFWDGCSSTHRMRAEWFDASSALVAFTRFSQPESESEARNFLNILVRLFSMLHAAALAEIEDTVTDNIENVEAFSFGLIFPDNLDDESLMAIKNSEAKVELIFAWIQQLVVHNIKTGVLAIPAPILSRAFQELANGMVAFHEALKISYVPFPFPYAQCCDLLLMLHWLVTPIVVSQWTTHPAWAALFSFIQSFILWSLNFIALELENPFGRDANDIDGRSMQQEMNASLSLLMMPSTWRLPTMKSGSVDLAQKATFTDTCSFLDAWRRCSLDDCTPITRSYTSAFVHGGTARQSMSMATWRPSGSRLSGSDQSQSSVGVRTSAKSDATIATITSLSTLANPGSRRDAGEQAKPDGSRLHVTILDGAEWFDEVPTLETLGVCGPNCAKEDLNKSQATAATVTSESSSKRDVECSRPKPTSKWKGAVLNDRLPTVEDDSKTSLQIPEVPSVPRKPETRTSEEAKQISITCNV